MLRVAVVDDHPVARYGIAGFLDEVDDLEFVGAVATPAELPRTEDGALACDVLVLDLYLDGDSPSIAEVAALSDEIPVLVMSASGDPFDVVAVIQVGAAGYLTKQAGPDVFATAVRTVAAGEFFLSPQLADLIQAAMGARPEPPGRPRLSDREQETLRYIARGFTHHQTANRLQVSKSTVDTYVARIRAKLSVGNKAELTLAALRYVRWHRDHPTGGTG